VERRALVEGHAEDADGAVELVEIAADARAQEGRNADERPVDASGFGSFAMGFLCMMPVSLHRGAAFKST